MSIIARITSDDVLTTAYEVSNFAQTALSRRV
jgi:hypothetical protein